MLTAQAHGGPDDEGTFLHNGVALGHRRLSIIDLSPAGHQPMTTADDNLIISFNGEIYNYQSLKRELMALGCNFRTKTDTEVILYAYREWGTKAFDRLEGIFAFALFDKQRNKVLLVRDHLGVKPVYYFADNTEFIFASEVKAFKALKPQWKENEDWKVLFLSFGSVPHPYTTLQNVFSLAPGSYLELNPSNLAMQVVAYYIPAVRKHTIHNTVDALTHTREATHAALHKNLIADAPLGVFLSGGIDSSLLTLLADKEKEGVRTVSINFEDATFDERPFQEIALKKASHVQHTSVVVTENMFWNDLDDIWEAMDQPSIDGVNSYFVSKGAKDQGLKAILSGLGADEVFGGYQSSHRIQWLSRFRLFPFKKSIARILGYKNKAYRRLMFLSIPGIVGDYLFLRGIHTPDTIAQVLGMPEEKVWQILRKVNIDVPDGLSAIEYASFIESKVYMTNQLLKDADYMSMWHGLEVRVPFLDIALIKDVDQIDPALRFRADWPKYLLTASNLDILPSEIIFRKKKGFTFPFALWLKNGADRFKSMLPEGTVSDSIFADFVNGRSHWSTCWSLAVLKQFKR